MPQLLGTECKFRVMGNVHKNDLKFHRKYIYIIIIIINFHVSMPKTLLPPPTLDSKSGFFPSNSIVHTNSQCPKTNPFFSTPNQLFLLLFSLLSIHTNSHCLWLRRRQHRRLSGSRKGAVKQVYLLADEPTQILSAVEFTREIINGLLGSAAALAFSLLPLCSCLCSNSCGCLTLWPVG